MKFSSPVFSLFLLAAGLLAPVVRAEQKMKPTEPLNARLWIGEDDSTVTLIGYSPGRVYAKATARGAGKEIDISTITRAVFELEVDETALNKAVRERRWVEAYRLFAPDFKRTMHYLNIPNNNAAPASYDMGTHMMAAAARMERQALTAEQREKVQKAYEACYKVFIACAKAEWNYLGMLSQLKGCRCLLKIDKPKTARYYLDRLPEPMPGDAAYGLYWLVQGEELTLKGEFRKALDAAVLSVGFANKDIDTFPDALMLSAKCYEEIREWHRARDVYFEVASIFPGTDWADDAADRLKFILDKGLTTDKEDSPIENVFFGVTENINELSRELLKRREEINQGSSESDAPPDE